MPFTPNFVWGAASASYQVEGAAAEDGRLPSVWDQFCRRPGAILDGSSGAVACDHYHRCQEDVDLMKTLGLGAYRFSIAWPRVIPEGIGPVNQAGLDFYDRLIDRLLAAGVTPYATLFHWDYPAALLDRGGWLNPDSPFWFADYAAAVARRLGDRLTRYFTINEPQCFIGLAYHKTEHAPGIRLPLRDTLRMAHHVLLGHGRVVQTLRETVPGAQIGWAPTGSAHYPATTAPADVDAARAAYFSVPEDNPFWSVSFWSDPVFLGKYNDDVVTRYLADLPDLGDDDLAVIARPLDFLGQNVYNGAPVRSDGRGGWEFVPRAPGAPITASKWPVTPDSLYWAPRFLKERYGAPLYITENGLSCADVVSLDGQVHDPGRIDFLARYLRRLRDAVDDGVDVRGYFHWCLTDNFEWARGYTERFGLVYCDFETGKRVIKDSGCWYRDVIRANGSNL